MLTNNSPWPLHTDDEIEAVSQVLLSGRTNYWTGNECREFEKEFAAYVGTQHAIAVMNGTVALEAALYALEIGPGDEVITTCRTFVATASSIIMRGATPVFADVDCESQNITAQSIAQVITPNTKAIIVVHLAGWPADMPTIIALAKQHGLKVIEDCAQAHGATIDGQMVGSWGDVAAFSFCQDKIMTTGGEGGMVTTNNPTIWEKIWAFKDHGKSYEKVYHKQHPPGFRWVHDSFGTNWRMTEMQAAIGRVQLRKLSTWLKIRKNNAAVLNERFQQHPALRVTLAPNNISHAYYKYYVFLRSEVSAATLRPQILMALQEKGIPSFSGICCRIYLEEAFTRQNLIPNKSLPNAEILGKTSLMFLVHPTLNTTDMKNTADSLMNILDNSVETTR